MGSEMNYVSLTSAHVSERSKNTSPSIEFGNVSTRTLKGSVF